MMKTLLSYKIATLYLLVGIFFSNTGFSKEESEITDKIEDKITEMQLSLPKVSSPVANYVPYTIVGNLVFISGQLPMEEGKVKFTGRVGEKVSEEEGAQAAQLCVLNILAQLKAAIGSLDKVKRCVKLSGFVNSAHEFTVHPKVINGASDLIVNVFGDKGKHARAAVGVSSLPLNAAVEVEAIFEIDTQKILNKRLMKQS